MSEAVDQGSRPSLVGKDWSTHDTIGSRAAALLVLSCDALGVDFKEAAGEMLFILLHSVSWLQTDSVAVHLYRASRATGPERLRLGLEIASMIGLLMHAASRVPGYRDMTSTVSFQTLCNKFMAATAP
jgi:hypothetical protein